MGKNDAVANIIDKAIFVFILIFLLSLSNSIFINQIGYYGALFLFLVRWVVVQDNPFSKSGLELPFILFILAEIISTLLSDNQSHAFNNLLKRILLLPIVYVIIASVKNVKRGTLYFSVYIGATLITVLIYLYFALHHYIDDLYGITQSGPSIFQYPITASEIISFTVIFLFAFLVNEKSNLKMKLLFGAGFILSSLALISTYKRTGWMGAAFGIIVILLIRKQYKTIIAGVLLLMAVIFIEEDISRIDVYSIMNNSVKFEKSIDTDGKAYNVFKDGTGMVVSDYQNGIIIYEDSEIKYKLETPAPVISLDHWTGSLYFAQLVDTRILTFNKSQDRLIQYDEFVPPGLTTDVKAVNNNLFILAQDSGLTVYTNPENNSEFLRYPIYNKFTNVFADSQFVCLSSADSGFRIISHSDGLLSEGTLVHDNTKLTFIFYENGFLYYSSENDLKVLQINSAEIKFLNPLKSIGNIVRAFAFENKIGFVSAGGLLTITETGENDLKILWQDNIGHTPNSVSVYDNKLYSTYVKPSRLLSIFDIYNQSNMSRFAFWNAGFKIWKDYPIFGVGDIDLAEYYKQYKNPYDKEIQGHMHNNFIHILVTLGAFGLIAVCFIFYKIISIELKIIREVKHTEFVSSYALGAFGTFCGFLFSGLTELNFWDHEITTLIWFIFGLNVALYNSVKPIKEFN